MFTINPIVLGRIDLQDRMYFAAKIMTVLFLLGIAATNSHALEYDVCPTCSYTTIQGAIDAIPAGGSGTIRLVQGTYSERGAITTSKNVVIQGGWNGDFSQRSRDPSLTTISGSGKPGCIAADAGTGVVIELALQSLKLSGNYFGGYGAGGGLHGGATKGGKLTISVDTCLVTGNAADNGHGGGIGLQAVDTGSVIDFTMESSRVSENSVVFYYAGGIMLSAHHAGAINATLTNCIVSDNSALWGGGFFVETDVYSPPAAPGTIHLFLTNTTVTKNRAWQYSYYGGGSGGGLLINGMSGTVHATVKNTILWGNTASNASTSDLYLDRTAGGTLAVMASYSNVGKVFNEPTEPAEYTADAGTVNTDPLFMNSSGKDYHLQSTSPMIDAGTAIGAPSVDFDGNARPARLAIDIGAYEFIPEAPGSPTITSVTAGNAQATVSFAAPGSDGGSAITGYTVTSNPAGGVDQQAGTTELTHLITGLTNGVSYRFTVTATNAAGTGIPSEASNPVTPLTTPGTPKITSVTAGNAQATVSFAAPGSDGGSPITGYTATSNPAGGVDQQAGTTELTHRITGLTNGVSYRFTVTATNSVGTGSPSAASGSVTPVIQGDITGDNRVNLTDAVVALQVLSWMPPVQQVNKFADVDGNARLGLAEIIYILQTVAEAR